MPDLATLWMLEQNGVHGRGLVAACLRLVEVAKQQGHGGVGVGTGSEAGLKAMEDSASLNPPHCLPWKMPLRVWVPGSLVSPWEGLCLEGGPRGRGSMGITFLAPAQPSGRALPATDSVEQLQFMCELLIPRGELVIVLGTHIGSLRPAVQGGGDTPGVYQRGLPSALCTNIHMTCTFAQHWRPEAGSWVQQDPV